MDVDFSPNLDDKDENAAQSPLWDVIDFTGCSSQAPDHELTEGIPTVRVSSDSSAEISHRMGKWIAQPIRSKSHLRPTSHRSHPLVGHPMYSMT